MEKNSKIFVAGHRGMVGSAVVRKLLADGYTNIITRSRLELDLTSQKEVEDFFEEVQPEYVFMCAAKVGGIKANNNFKADFIWDNIMIQSNIIKNSHKYGVTKMIFLGSSCIYPKISAQPIKEEQLLSGYLEETNDAYAIAKISGIKMCQSFNQQYGTDFVSVMPCNLYGIGDNYHPENSHVFPAIIKKLHDAKVRGDKTIMLWGDGTPKREFLCSDDLADALVFLMNNTTKYDLINVGSGVDLSIYDLARLIKGVVYPDCEVLFNGEISINGTMRKVMDVSKINDMGWTRKIRLDQGVRLAYKDFLSRES